MFTPCSFISLSFCSRRTSPQNKQLKLSYLFWRINFYFQNIYSLFLVCFWVCFFLRTGHLFWKIRQYIYFLNSSDKNLCNFTSNLNIFDNADRIFAVQIPARNLDGVHLCTWFWKTVPQLTDEVKWNALSRTEWKPKGTEHSQPGKTQTYIIQTV